MTLSKDQSGNIQHPVSPFFELRIGYILKTIRVDVDPKYEDEFLLWYNEEHEPLLWKIPGVLGMWKAKRLGEGEQRYFYLYAHQNLDVQKGEIYKQASLTDWAKKIYPFLKNFDTRNYEVIVPGPARTGLKKGNIIRTVEVNVTSEYEQEFKDWFKKEHIPLLSNILGVFTTWQAINLGERGPKYLTVHFHENTVIQEGQDYKSCLLYTSDAADE